VRQRLTPVGGIRPIMITWPACKSGWLGTLESRPPQVCRNAKEALLALLMLLRRTKLGDATNLASGPSISDVICREHRCQQSISTDHDWLPFREDLLSVQARQTIGHSACEPDKTGALRVAMLTCLLSTCYVECCTRELLTSVKSSVTDVGETQACSSAALDLAPGDNQVGLTTSSCPT
jgi:hypothetical protein